MIENSPTVQDGKIVALRYSLRTMDGSMIEDIMHLAPVRYRHGAEGIHHSLQRSITGMKVGEQAEFCLSPDEAPELDQQFLVNVIIDEVRDKASDDAEIISGRDPLFPGICDADCACHRPGNENS